MISPEHKKILMDMNNTQYGAVLRELLRQKTDELSDVRNLKKDSSMAEEARGRQIALSIIDELFGFMEGKEIKIKDKNQYT